MSPLVDARYRLNAGLVLDPIVAAHLGVDEGS
jgi:hypothetical protein